MKKAVFIFLMLSIVLNCSVYAADNALFTMRGKIFEESQKIKLALVNSKDVVLVSSMWDSCVILVNQLDAYFSMLGIFNAINNEELTADPINYIYSWLKGIKDTNELNIKSLNKVSQINDAKTKQQIEILKAYFKDTNDNISAELKKFDALRKTLGAQKAQ